MRKYISIIVVIVLFLISANSYSQLQVTPNNNPTQLAATLAGPGVTVSGATMNCPSNAVPPNNPSGTFVGTASNLGIAGGILLTSGDIQWAVGPNNSSSAGADNLVTFNDPDLLAIDPNLTNDVCILEFNAVPTCSSLAFTFSFGSEEYPEFVNSFNDGFGIFVTGANPSGPAYSGYNMALIPSTATPVSINNVNDGNYNCPGPPSGPCVNCAYYVDNCAGTTIQYDAFTKPITVTLNVVPCSSYHFKLAVADALDNIYDTGVFFAMQSLVCATTLTVTASSTPAACSSNNGTATVTNVAGGTAPYTYTWNTTPPQNTQTATGLAPGNYTVNVVDHNGCLSGTQTVTITNTGGFTATSNQTNVTCFGNNNGSASVNPTGGNLPYTYSWSTNPVQTSPSISNIPAGNYTCTITDATGCTQTATFTITQSAAMSLTITNVVNVSCFQGKNGSADANAAGGTVPYTYSWNSNPTQATPTASNLSAGNYTVTITDASGCTATQTVVITQPTGMTLSTSETPASCGVKNGTASATSSGGAQPYTYLWLTNPVQNTSTATGLTGGTTYTVIVSDANGCTQSQSINVTGGTPPIANFSFIPDTVNLLDPTVYLTDLSSGGAATWNWNFDDPLSGANNFSIIENPSHTFSDTGIYCIKLVVKDQSGFCADSIIKCLEVISPYTFYIPNTFTPNLDGKNEVFLAYGTCISKFHMYVFDRWGNLIFESDDIHTGWTGAVKNQGKVVQEDVYVWKVNITDTYGKTHNYIGNVNLVR